MDIYSNLLNFTKRYFNDLVATQLVTAYLMGSLGVTQESALVQINRSKLHEFTLMLLGANIAEGKLIQESERDQIVQFHSELQQTYSDILNNCISTN